MENLLADLDIIFNTRNRKYIADEAFPGGFTFTFAATKASAHAAARCANSFIKLAGFEARLTAGDDAGTWYYTVATS